MVRPVALVWLLLLCGVAPAAERVTLRDGFEVDCARLEPAGDRVRLYLLPASASADAAENYIEVAASDVVQRETLAVVPESPAGVSAVVKSNPPTQTPAASLTALEMRQMLTAAGEQHDVDADLLASVVHAESSGQVHAVSRAGAEGLMQLMPSTAASLGVKDSFAPEQNIRGGTAYLDALLTRYHNDIALALAAYNAGPAAVDHYHGVPPYAETRAYVARVIREFNRRKRAALVVGSVSLKAVAAE